MQGANPPVQTEQELILVLLADGDRSARHERVAGLLGRLGATIELDFGTGWLVGASRDSKPVIAAHRDVSVAGGVHQRTDRTLPRRTRRLAHD